MRNTLPFAITSLLATASVFAQDEAANSAPPETVPLIYVALFALIFFGMIGGFFAYMWWREREVKPEK